MGHRPAALAALGSQVSMPSAGAAAHASTPSEVRGPTPTRSGLPHPTGLCNTGNSVDRADSGMHTQAQRCLRARMRAYACSGLSLKKSSEA